VGIELIWHFTVEWVTLPASVGTWRAALILILAAGTIFPVPSHAANSYGPSQSSAVKSSLTWLASNEKTDGSFGSSQISTPPAAYALWLNDSHSPKASASFSWLASQLDNSSSYAWGEADIPGQILYTLSTSGNVRLLSNASDSSGLLAYQQTNGGFLGWYDSSSGQQTTSSIDTAMALWGLIEAHAISSSKQQQAVNYILSLQNHDGSFNLTLTEATNHFETLGLESISTTALVVLVLKSASLTASDTRVSNALDFLNAAASTNFTASHDSKGHVYAAALSALAFRAFGRAVQATAAVAFILLQQNPDGGFRDIGRLSSGSNALDTGWAAIALEQVQLGPLFSPFLSPVLFVGLIVAVGVVAVVGVVAAYLLLKRRARRPTASGPVSTLPTL
jgi:hypothetical protein